jgi:hypothetical protein
VRGSPPRGPLADQRLRGGRRRRGAHSALKRGAADASRQIWAAIEPVGDDGEGEAIADARIGLEMVCPAATYRRL